MDSVVITGGTGLIGTALSRLLVLQGYSVIILSRDPASHRNQPSITYAAWNIEEQSINEDAISKADLKLISLFTTEQLREAGRT